jgi:predicted NBD/HSP70 family sugar kinase
MNKYVLDIGATNTKFAIMGDDGEIILKDQTRTVYDSAEGFLSVLTGFINKYPNRGDAVAVSTNGRMSPDGNTYRAYIPKLIQGLNLKEELEKRTALPVSVLNDGFSAALGEWWKGAGRGSQNMMAIVLGSGMGGGLILGGRLYQGPRLNAAMFFAMLKSYGPDTCNLTAMDTTFALLQYQFAAAKQLPLDEKISKLFFEYAARGDEFTNGMLDRFSETVAFVAYNAALLLDLDRVVITGGLSREDALVEGINRKLLEIPRRGFGGPNAALLEQAVVDRNDFIIQMVRGELALDANLYGALYYLITEGEKK